jgi:hypothetical protein
MRSGLKERVDVAGRTSCWVFRSRDLRRGTEPQMSLKQFPSHIPSGTERFHTLSAF